MNIYIDGQGNRSITDIHPDFIVNRPTVAIGDEKRSLPKGYSLGQNYPNPFNPTTTIEYKLLSEKRDIRLEVHNIYGQKVKSLYQGSKEAGEHYIKFDGKDSKGKDLPSGIYFYQLGNQFGILDKKKMTLIR